MQLYTFGRFGLFDGDPDAKAPRVIGPAKPLALLVYLALAPKRRASREQLVGLLWSDVDQNRARSTLRQTVWALRKRLGEDALEADGDDIVLTLPLSLDTERFQQAITSGDLHAAWALYGGPFITDFGIAGGAGFEQWADLQRDRWRASWLSVGATLARQHLAAHRPRDAAAITRRLVDDSPDRLDLWVMHLEALLVDGDRVQAMGDAETLRALLQDEGRRPDAALRALLDRIRREPEVAAAATGPRRPDLVGREKAFADLQQARKMSMRGAGAVCVVRGAAGLGKSRLLLEFRRRLEDLGATVLMVRARPADRDVPYQLVAAIVQALADCPGAAGVASATASVLVDLVPTLSNSYPRAVGVHYDADDALRLRTLAVAELVHVVSDETPIVLMVDDLHWADDMSRQLLASLSERIGGDAALLVMSLRPTHGIWTVPSGAVVIDLPPLSGEQLEQLLASLAECDPALMSELGRLLLQASAGVPLMVIATIDLALERQWLCIDNDRWSCPSMERLGKELARGSVLERLLQDLPDDGLSILLSCALAQRSLPTDLLEAVVNADALAPLASALEQRGLLLRSGDQWDLAHDTLADAAMGIATSAHQRETGRRLGHALLREREPTARTLQQAGRLLIAADDDEGQRCFRRWVPASARRRYWRDPLTAASEFLGTSATVEQARRLASSLSPVARLMNGYPFAAAALALLAIGVVGGALVLQAQRWIEPRATQMTLTEPVTWRGFLWDTTAMTPDRTTADLRHPTPMRVSFRDAEGNPSRRAPSRARIRLADVNGAARLEGALDRPVIDGEADFRDLVLLGWGTFRLRAEAAGLPPVESSRMYATGANVDLNVSHVRIEAGTVNGQAIDSIRRTIRVRANEELRGTIRFHTLTDMRAASIILGAVATWGDHRRNWLRLSALASYGEEVLDIKLEDRPFRRTLRAPSEPGTYHIVFLHDAQTEMAFIASRTAWQLGKPVWDDGDDIADLDAASLERLDRTGRTEWPRLALADAVTSPVRTARIPGLVIGTTLTVIVQR